CITNSAKGIYYYGGTLDCRVAGGKFDNVNNCVMMTMRTYSGDVSPHYFNRFDFMEVFNSSSVFGFEVFLDPTNSPYVGMPP
ncbi:hypothetical protein, partial [Streptococcus pneumoniae]|uniref:hypothetical protein n=1 Tax=Streptococcus pneumoniae TaxID=1313 RepID=UPI001E3C1ED2